MRCRSSFNFRTTLLGALKCFATETAKARSREICPGGVGFETRFASGACGAMLVANLTRPVLHGVSVRVIGLPSRPPSRCFGETSSSERRAKVSNSLFCEGSSRGCFQVAFKLAGAFPVGKCNGRLDAPRAKFCSVRNSTSVVLFRRA